MGVPPPVVPAVRRLPGVRFVAPVSTGFEQLAIQLGGNAHPALGNKLVRRALAYGIDRTALVRQILGDDQSVCSCAQQRPAPGPEPLLRAELERVSLPACAGSPPARAGWLPQGIGRNLLLRRGASLVALRDDRRELIRAQVLPLIQAQLRAAGVEVVPVFAAPASFFGQILPQGLFDVALFSWVGSPAASWADVYGCERQTNFTGVLPAARHRRPQPGRQDPRRSATRRVFNRADRGLARDVPTIPLFQFVFTAAYDTSVRNFVFLPGTRSGTPRSGGSRSSPRGA